MGNTNEQLEAQFSDLAYASLQEKDSELMNYVIGFQLVDANEELTRALGFFALNISGKYYYIPTFFIAGKLKPLDLMYAKDKDMFLPLTLKWITYLDKNSSSDLGTRVTKPRIGLSNPDISIFYEPPTTGRVSYASVKESLLNRDTLKDLDYYLKLPVEQNDGKVLEKLASTGNTVKEAVLRGFMSKPELLKLACEYLGWDNIKKSLEFTPENPLAPQVEVLVKNAGAFAKAEMDAINDDAAKKALLHKGYAVIDKRPITSITFKVQHQEDYYSPTKNSIYLVIDRSGRTRKVLFVGDIVKFNMGFNDPNDNRRARPQNVNSDARKSLAIDLTTGTACIVDNQKILARLHPHKPVLMEKMWKAAVDVKDLKIDKAYVLLHKKGSELIVSQPFTVRSTAYDPNGIIRYRVYPRYTAELRPTIAGYKFDEDSATVQVLPNHGPRISNISGNLVTTSDVKAFPLADSYAFGEAADLYGSLGAFDAALREEGICPVSLHSDGTSLSIHGEDENGKVEVKDNLDKKAALEELVNKYGLSGKDATAMMDETLQSGKSKKLVKKAGPVPINDYTSTPNIEDPQVYYDEYIGANATPFRQHEQFLRNPNVRSYRKRALIGDNYVGNLSDQGIASFDQGGADYGDSGYGEMDSAFAQRAAESGDPEVFQAGVVGSLAGISDANELVTSYLPDLERAVDRLGRMIYLFWWKYDQFKDQYSIDELSETEDKLRSLFKDLGDLILKFKSKGTAAASVSVDNTSV